MLPLLNRGRQQPPHPTTSFQAQKRALSTTSLQPKGRAHPTTSSQPERRAHPTRPSQSTERAVEQSRITASPKVGSTPQPQAQGPRSTPTAGSVDERNRNSLGDRGGSGTGGGGPSGASEGGPSTTREDDLALVSSTMDESASGHEFWRKSFFFCLALPCRALWHFEVTFAFCEPLPSFDDGRKRPSVIA